MSALVPYDDSDECHPMPPYTPSPSPLFRPRPLPAVPRTPGEHLRDIAQRYADSGWVCLGPEGKAVSGYDRCIYAMLSEERPREVSDWFERACDQGFFDSKVRVPNGRGDEPVYAVFRGAGGGPGLYRSWDEVAPCVIGRHGTLYQKCHNWLEAAARMMQAWCIGGILAHVDDAAWDGADFSLWLSALAPSSFPRLYSSAGLMPSHPSACLPDETPGRDHALRFLHWEPKEWHVLDMGKMSPADADERTPPLRPLAPPPSRVRSTSTVWLEPSISRVPPRSPSPHPFASSLPSRQAASLSAFGIHPPSPRQLWTSSPSLPPRSPTPHPTRPAATAGLYTLHRGSAPWMYFTQFPDALDAFRHAVRSGQVAGVR